MIIETSNGGTAFGRSAQDILTFSTAVNAASADPIASFDPAAPCPAEGQQPGAYPDLEALLPATHEGKAPDSVDSGRLCTDANLGTLAAAGIGASPRAAAHR